MIMGISVCVSASNSDRQSAHSEMSTCEPYCCAFKSVCVPLHSQECVKERKADKQMGGELERQQGGETNQRIMSQDVHFPS